MTEHEDDIEKIAAMCREQGLKIGLLIVQAAWEAYSDHMNVAWMRVPDKSEEVVSIVREFMP